ncbi:MAG: hypothetical protein RSE41_00295 [Clostridia bacterium]
MKKFFSLLLVISLILGFTSCERDIIINIEYVPCTFVASNIVPDIEDKPITKLASNRISTPARKIKYLIDYADTSVKDTSGITYEDDVLVLNLLTNKEFTYYFVHDDEYELDANNIRINSMHTYHANKTMIIQGAVSEYVVLKRQSAQFIAKQGNIPGGTTMYVETKVINQFDWTKPAIIDDNTVFTETYDSENKSVVDGVNTWSVWMLGSDSFDNVEVYVYLKNYNNIVVKSGTYKYSVKKNHIKTVTYNINDVNEPGFFVTIDDSPMIGGDDSNQQIGKDQI